MEDESEITIDIELDGIVSGICYAPFNKAKTYLERKNLRIISLKENAGLVMLAFELRIDTNAVIHRMGNFTKEGGLFIPGKGSFLIPESPILEFAEQATNAHRVNKEFYLTNKDYVEKLLVNSYKLPKRTLDIPVKNIGIHELTAQIYGELAKPYSEFLEGLDHFDTVFIEVPSEEEINMHEKPFVRQLWRGSSYSPMEINYGYIKLDTNRSRGINGDLENIKRKLGL